MRLRHLILSAGLAAVAATGAHAAVTKNTLPPGKDGKPSRILESAEVGPGSSTLFVSGQLASPLPEAAGKPMGQLTMADFGDTKTQALSALGKIKGILEKHGYTMKDVIKMTLFLAADPKLGKMDFEGVNAAFESFFNVPENPTTTARSAIQVAALAGPNFLVEIEVIAAKSNVAAKAK